MASWDESSATQGAVSGAAIGTAIAPGKGTAVGAGIGILLGGLLGGRAKDAAKKAEERRLAEIKEAIDRQNKDTYEAKVMAERWALADVGVGDQDRYIQAQSDRGALSANLQNEISKMDKALQLDGRYAQYAQFAPLAPSRKSSDKEMAMYQYNISRANEEFKANEGIIANLDPSSPITKY